MFRRFALTAALVLSAATAQADPVSFNDGTTSVSNFQGFDPGPGNVLNVGVNGAAAAFVADPTYNPITGNVSAAAQNNPAFNFTGFGQANMSGITGGPGTINGIPTSGATVSLPGGYTVVFAVPEQLTNVTGPVGQVGASAQFRVNPNAFDASGNPSAGFANYFQIFRVGGLGGDDRAGTGFNGSAAQLVMSGHFVPFSAISSIGILATTQPNALDQAGANDYGPGSPNWNGSTGPMNTQNARGSADFRGVVDSFNPAFFTLQPGESLIGASVALSTQLQLPFIAANPSAQFLTTTTSTSVGQPTTVAGAGQGNTVSTGTGIGGINGALPAAGGGNSVQVQQDANIAITPIRSNVNTPTPEPVSLAVFAGVMGVGGLVYRKRRVAK